jgi:transposase-like protein
LGEIVYLYLDARYEKVRMDGQIRDTAILIAAGVGRDGRRCILGVSVSMSEAEQHWRLFLEGLIERGLQGVRLIISDDHAGLHKARQVLFTGIPWQRCQFHLQQNASQYVPRKRMRSEVAADIRAIFNAPDRAQAEGYLKQIVIKYEDIASELADWLEAAIPEGLTVFDYPEAHRRRIRTGNMLERVSQEIKRRTRVIRIFPNQSSCLRLVSAVLMEISEDWETGRIYLNVGPD